VTTKSTTEAEQITNPPTGSGLRLVKVPMPAFGEESDVTEMVDDTEGWFAHRQRVKAGLNQAATTLRNLLLLQKECRDEGIVLGEEFAAAVRVATADVATESATFVEVAEAVV
jgi:hypothetical protein